MKKIARTFALLLVVGVAAAAGGLAVAYTQCRAYGDSSVEHFLAPTKPSVDVTVAKGTGLKALAALLKSKGLISDDVMFYRYVRFIAKKTNVMKAGDYQLSPSMTVDQIIAVLETGRQAETKFTIPEGLRKEEIAKLIAGRGLSTEKELLDVMNSAETIMAFGVPKVGAAGQDQVPGGVEGYLYPDTYQFPKGTKAATIVKRLRERLDEIVDDKMKARMKELEWNLHKTLTLAAIVEKETGASHERPHISSVFHNRMRLGMKMQTDPTVIYGIENYDGNIRKKDLLTPHPYNTYTIPGLPPGPIASPGLEAIRAALFPTTDDDLYFVSRNDGTHIFCPTLACHEAAVKEWQVKFFQRKKQNQ